MILNGNWINQDERREKRDLVSGDEQENSGGGGGNCFLDFFLRRRQLRLGCKFSSRLGWYSIHSLDEELVIAEADRCPELPQRCTIWSCFFFCRCCWRALLVLRDLISHTSGSDSPPEVTTATVVSSWIKWYNIYNESLEMSHDWFELSITFPMAMSWPVGLWWIDPGDGCTGRPITVVEGTTGTRRNRHQFSPSIHSVWFNWV